MQRSLFIKYLRITMIIVFSSLVVLGCVMLTAFSQYTKNDKRKLLTQSATSMASITAAVNLSSSEAPQFLTLFAQSFSMNIDADIFITDLNGEVIFGAYAGSDSVSGSSFTPPTSIPAEAAQKAACGSYTGTGLKNGIYPNKNFYVVGVPLLTSGEEPTAIGAVFAATSAATITEYQLAALRMFLWAALASFLLSFCLVGIFAYRLVKPLRQISAAAKSFGNGDFSVRVPVSSQDEVGQLAQSFNNMADSLSNSETMNRSFVANVSHELKTPMTTIAGFIDGILDGTIPPERQDYYLGIVSDEVKRLSRLVQTMLNLSRIDNGKLQLRPADFDMSDTVLSTVLTFEKIIDEKQIDIRGLDTLSPHTVHGDKDLLHQVVYNLIENAVKFTNPGGCITFTVIDSIDRIVVSIENSGNGIAADELPLIFEKFYKTDKSRSQDKNGMGLGLYLVKTIVKLHGGDIAVSSTINKSTRFSFFIPKPHDTQKLKPTYTVSVEDAVITDRPQKERRSHSRDEEKNTQKDGQNNE